MMRWTSGPSESVIWFRMEGRGCSLSTVSWKPKKIPFTALYTTEDTDLWSSPSGAAVGKRSKTFASKKRPNDLLGGRELVSWQKAKLVDGADGGT